MMESFDKWQKRRQGMEYSEKNEISPSTSLNILEAQERCTISINIPFKRLNDHGDQRILYKEVVRVFEHYNYLYKKQSGSNNDIFPIQHIRTVTRGKKHYKTIQSKKRNWLNLKNKHRSYYQRLPYKQRKELEYKHYTDKILINQVFIDFDIWVLIFQMKLIIQLVNGRLNVKIQDKINWKSVFFSLYQCYSCGGIACRDGRCRHYNEALGTVVL